MKKGSKSKNVLRYIDKRLLIVSLLFIIFGLIMIFSASSISAVLQYNQTEYYFFKKQLIIIIASSLIGIFLLFFPIKNYKYLSVLGIIGIIGVLFLLKTYGTVTNSARSWFNFGPFSLQPSEFAKTFIILFLSSAYGYKKFTKVTDLLIPLVPCVIVTFFVAAEPDLGTALIITLITAMIFLFLPFSKNDAVKLLKTISAIGILLGAIFLVSAPDFLTDMQEARLNYRNPCSRYLEETGYQVCNGYIAINNGGFTGVGLGNSTQKYLYLPEAHTDFIFPIIVEELGLIGGFIVLTGYMVLLFSLLVIAVSANNIPGSIIAFGTFSYILIHLIFNIGGLLALIPLTGVPLPFLSYGGSYMMNLIILISITQRVAIETKIENHKLEIKKAIGG